MNARQKRWIDSIANLSQLAMFDHDIALFIGCQFALESAYGTNRLAREYHNISSMKAVKLRFHRGYNSPGDSWMIYECIAQCVEDYVYWLLYNKLAYFDVSNIDRFSKFIVSHGYCPDSDYIRRIYSIYNEYQTFNNYD